MGRFYIQPAGDMSQGLQGLSGAIDRYGEIKRKKDEQTRLAEINKQAAEILKVGNAEDIAEFSLKNPEVAQNLLSTSLLKDTKAKDFYVNTLFQIVQNPEDIEKITETRRALALAQGIGPREPGKENLKEMYDEDPEGTLNKLEQEIAFLAPAKYKAYKDALKSSEESTADIRNFEYYNELSKTNPELAEKFAIQTGITKKVDDARTADEKNIETYQELMKTNPEIADMFAIGAGFKTGEKDNSTAAMKNFDKYIELLNTNPEQAKLFGDSIGIDRVAPHSDIAKLKTDLDNELISEEDYENKRNKILNPTMKTNAELVAAALRGDVEAKNILEKIAKDSVELSGKKSEAATSGKLKALYESMDLDSVAQGVLEGRETIDNVRNTFGVPIQEVVRAKVMEKEPDFNFVQPRAIQKSLSASLAQQQKNRGAMGSFVQNINGQVDKVEEIMQEVVDRFGVRALDIPWRKLKTVGIGAGDERVLEAYTKEISVEIFKLSQGSTASVALLPEAGRKEWEAIHDVNLSWPEMKKVMLGTRDMANIRLKSVNDELKETVKKLGNIRDLENEYEGGPDGTGPGAEFQTDPADLVTVKNPDTGETETWNIKTEKRVR